MGLPVPPPPFILTSAGGTAIIQCVHCRTVWRENHPTCPNCGAPMPVTLRIDAPKPRPPAQAGLLP